MGMKIAIVGGTGFIGRNLASALVARGHAVTAISRLRPHGFVDCPNHSFRCANVATAESLQDAFADVDAVVYSVGILREDRSSGQTFESVQLRGAENVVNEARSAGVRRIILISANGAEKDGTPYQTTKFRAEEIVRNSGLDYSILRPSVVFGDSEGSQEFSWQLYRDIVRPPVPAPNFLTRWLPPRQEVVMSPVAIDDVVAAIVRQLEDPFEGKQTFELGGPETLSWRTMLERVAAATKRTKLFIPAPIKLMMLPAWLLGGFSFFPVTVDQLRMLAEGNVAASDDLVSLIGRDPVPFTPENLEYLCDAT